MSLVIVVGDTNHELARKAKLIDPQAYLVTDDNVLDIHNGTIYTSIGDLSSISKFYNLLSQSSKIICAFPKIWSDQKNISNKYSMHWLTSMYVLLVSKYFDIPVHNFVDTNIKLQIPLPRQSNTGSQLWVAGCSTTFGSGLVSPEQRYANILGNELQMPFTVLAETGSSINWACGQLLQSDIRSGDIVICGLTTASRDMYYYKNTVNHLNTSFYKKHPTFNKIVPLDYLESDDLFYKTMQSINAVRNFCKKLGAKLLLVSIHTDIDLQSCIVSSADFLIIHGSNGCDWENSFFDYGTDNLHPGPLTHQYYASKIKNKLKELDYI